jgi:hypothetical protein
LRREDGWFETGPRSTAFEVDGGDRSMVLYGDDVTGDGLADLIVRGDDGISIHPGLASHDGKKLVRKRPLELGDVSPTEDAGEAGVVIGGEGGVSAWTAEGARRPRLADLDGDGKMEILVLVRGARDELWVLDVRAAS